MTDKLRSVSVRIPEEMATDIEAIAAVDGTSMSEEVRRAISSWIDARRGDEAFQTELRKQMHVAQQAFDRLSS